MPNDLSFRILENWGISGKPQSLIKLLPRSHSSFWNENFVSTSKTLEKQKFNFSSSALFPMKTRFEKYKTRRKKYFANDCRYFDDTAISISMVLPWTVLFVNINWNLNDLESVILTSGSFLLYWHKLSDV